MFFEKQLKKAANAKNNNIKKYNKKCIAAKKKIDLLEVI